MRDDLRARLQEAVKTISLTDFPTQVIVESIAVCNLECPACPSRLLERPRGRMDMGLFRKIVDEMARENPDCELYLAFMGEALLYKDLFQAIHYAREQGLRRILLNTNATKLDAKARAGLIDAAPHRVIVSIDGHSAATYGARRVGGDYVTVRDNTLALLREVRESGAPVSVWVQMIVDDGNAHEEESFKAFWLEAGAVVKTRPQLTWGGRVGRNFLADLTLERVPCPWLMRQIVVTWDGSVGMCDADHEAALSLGNVRDMTIREVWNGRLAELRRAHMAGDFSFSLCTTCDDWKVGKSKTFFPTPQGGA